MLGKILTRRRRIRHSFLVIVLIALTASTVVAAPLFIKSDNNSQDILPELPSEVSAQWEGTLKSASNEVTSGAAKTVLADGKITLNEVKNVRQEFRSCVENAGVSDMTIDQDGRVKFDTPKFNGRINQQVDSCGRTSGFDEITAWLNTIRANPEHLDYNTIMAACLIRKGVVNADYSAEQFASDNKDFSFQFTASQDEGKNAVLSCQSDPTGDGE